MSPGVYLTSIIVLMGFGIPLLAGIALVCIEISSRKRSKNQKQNTEEDS